MIKLLLMFLPFYLYPPEAREMTDRLVPEGYQGNYWGPEASRARREGTTPPIEITPQMARWDRWGARFSRTATSCSGWAMHAYCTGFSP